MASEEALLIGVISNDTAASLWLRAQRAFSVARATSICRPAILVGLCEIETGSKSIRLTPPHTTGGISNPLTLRLPPTLENDIQTSFARNHRDTASRSRKPGLAETTSDLPTVIPACACVSRSERGCLQAPVKRPSTLSATHCATDLSTLRAPRSALYARYEVLTRG